MSIGDGPMVGFDSTDIAGLSALFRGLAGRAGSSADGSWIALDAPDGWQIGLRAVADHLPPQWPGQERPSRPTSTCASPTSTPP